MKFTRISDDGMKFSKLDRFLITNEFGVTWRNLGVKVVERKWSDHFPILLYEDKKNFGPKPFKVFDSWLKEDAIEDVVKQAWDTSVVSNRPDCIFRDKLKRAKESLKEWGKRKFRSIETELSNWKEEVEQREVEVVETVEADQGGWDETSRSRWCLARGKWLHLEEKKIGMLKQKAKVKWITDGDENSKLFHAAVRYRERKNSIQGLNTNTGWTEEPNQIKEFAYEFFKKKFSSNRREGPYLCGEKFKKISREDADFL